MRTGLNSPVLCLSCACLVLERACLILHGQARRRASSLSSRSGRCNPRLHHGLLTLCPAPLVWRPATTLRARRGRWIRAPATWWLLMGHTSSARCARLCLRAWPGLPPPLAHCVSHTAWPTAFLGSLALWVSGPFCLALSASLCAVLPVPCCLCRCCVGVACGGVGCVGVASGPQGQ